jgi:hypothetical protein
VYEALNVNSDLILRTSRMNSINSGIIRVGRLKQKSSEPPPAAQMAANRRGGMMWFKRNGHFAKNGVHESEVSYESPQSQKAIHPRVQR